MKSADEARDWYFKTYCPELVHRLETHDMRPPAEIMAAWSAARRAALEEAAEHMERRAETIRSNPGPECRVAARHAQDAADDIRALADKDKA